MAIFEMSVEPTSLDELRYTCPMCWDPLWPPVFQCHNGHLMCQDCSSRLKICSVCRAILPEVNKLRNSAIEQIILMIRYPCPNQIDGCVDKLPLNQLEAHRLECYYTKFPLCRDILGDNSCEEIRICDFEEHIARKYQNRALMLTFELRPSTLPDTKHFPISWIVPHSESILKFPFYFEGTRTVLIVVIEIDAARDLIKWKPYVLAGRVVASQLNLKLFISSGNTVKFMLESRIFNVESKPEELLLCPSLSWKYVRTNFCSPDQSSNEAGYHHIGFKISQKSEPLVVNDEAKSGMDHSSVDG